MGARFYDPRVAWQERIVIAPDLHHGDPCIQGTRIFVSMIVGSLADGMTTAQIREAYPQPADEDIGQPGIFGPQRFITVLSPACLHPRSIV
ncbi:MAG: DUF433 domain-containing protein [Anaerolineae bacterium]|nr:DUF433 domain-containing protein [Anaerolineae bacterium]